MAQSPVRTSVGGSEKSRLLVVDDESDFVASLTDILESRGYIVKGARNAREARKIIVDFDAQVVLLDINLGNESGIDLLAELKALRPRMLFVMMTAYAALDNAIEALQRGAYDYLQKPFGMPTLLATLDRCFEKIRLEGEMLDTQRMLRNREAALQSILRMAPIGIGVIRDGMISQVNAHVGRMLGYSTDDLQGRMFSLLFLGEKDFAVAMDKGMQLAAAGERAEPVKTRWECKDGRVIDVLLNLAPIDPDDAREGMTFVALDVTK